MHERCLQIWEADALRTRDNRQEKRIKGEGATVQKMRRKGKECTTYDSIEILKRYPNMGKRRTINERRVKGGA